MRPTPRSGGRDVGSEMTTETQMADKHEAAGHLLNSRARNPNGRVYRD